MSFCCGRRHMQQPDQALTLEGIVTKIIFFNEENAYLVLELET